MIPTFTRLRLIVRHSSHDDLLAERFLRHLSTLANRCSLEVWTEDEIPVGASICDHIERAISQAHVAILLLTPELLASDVFQRVDLPSLQTRACTDGLRIVPILLKSCTWKMHPWLSGLQLLPRDHRALFALRGDKRQAAFARTIEDITTLITSIGTAVDERAQSLDADVPFSRHEPSPPGAASTASSVFAPRPSPPEGIDTDLSVIRTALLAARNIAELRLCLHQVDAVLAKSPNKIDAKVLKDDVLRALARTTAAAHPTVAPWGPHVPAIASLLLGIGITAPLCVSLCGRSGSNGEFFRDVLAADFTSEERRLSSTQASSDICRGLLVHDSTYSYSFDPGTGTATHRCRYRFSAGEAESLERRRVVYDTFVLAMKDYRDLLDPGSSVGFGANCGVEHRWILASSRHTLAVALRTETCTSTELPDLDVSIFVRPTTPPQPADSGPLR